MKRFGVHLHYPMSAVNLDPEAITSPAPLVHQAPRPPRRIPAPESEDIRDAPSK